MDSPYPFSLRQLQYVLAVAEALSFRQAAERCHVSQPSLSAQLAELEAALGVRLFERDRKRVLPTAAGRELVERARRVLLDAGDLLQAARRMGDPLAGRLSIGVIPTLAPYLLPRLAPALRTAYPRLAVAWIEDRTAALAASLQAGNLDAALLALEAEIGAVEQEVILRDPFVLAAPPRHPLGKLKGPAQVAELRGTDVLVLEDGHCFGQQALAFCAKARAPALEFRATSLPTLAQMVAGGNGVTLLPDLAAETEARAAGLKLRRFADPAPYRTIGLVWRRGAALAEPLRQIAATVRDAVGRQ